MKRLLSVFYMKIGSCGDGKEGKNGNSYGAAL